MSKEKLPFRTAYNWDRGEKTPSGTPMQKEYTYKIDKYGRKILECTGETNLYEIIQSSLEETKIENILRRVAIGDNTALRPDGLYTDLTEMPSNLIEARQAMQNLENVWNDLDIDTRRKYNFDVEEFIAASGTDGWLKDMGLISEAVNGASEGVTEAFKSEGGSEE